MQPLRDRRSRLSGYLGVFVQTLPQDTSRWIAQGRQRYEASRRTEVFQQLRILLDLEVDVDRDARASAIRAKLTASELAFPQLKVA